jgi:hypothetical protein
MSQALSPSLARCYGMARVARVWIALCWRSLNGLLAPHRFGRVETKPHEGGSSPTRSMKCGEVVGIHASRSANRLEALEPVRQGVHRYFGAIGPGGRMD